MIIQIAKAELRTLFYSPVAWFLILAFLVQCAYFFTTGLAGLAELQDMIVKNNPGYKGLTGSAEAGYTRRLFLGGEGVFSSVLQNLYLFIPLLTMGLIGREIQNGTSKLLYSSPVKLHQIVSGKYLAIMIYNLILVLILGIFMVTASMVMIKVDHGMLLSAMLGFYLLTCTYTAIGMFMSAITTHQIIAAVGTFLIVFCLSFMDSLWQKYDFVRDLTFFLHLPGRTQKMLLGLITTKDVIYFLVIMSMFIMFTILRLRAAREANPWYVNMMRYCFVVVLGLMIGYISSRPAITGYWDTTAQKVNTIHEKTQQLIKEMGDEPLEVTLYSNFLEPSGSKGLPEARNAYLTNVWERYLRFKPGIKFNYVYYYDHDSTIMGKNIYRAFPGKSIDFIAAKSAEYSELDLDDFMKPAEIRKRIDLKPENMRLVMQLKYKGRTEFLRTFNDNIFWPQEVHVAAAFKRLIDGAAPKIAFVSGHYERNIFKTGEREYAKHTASKLERSALVNLGFDVDTISLDTEDIPAGAATLVLADPKSALSETCLQKIRLYLATGGNMFIMGEPGKQQMVNPVLKQLGVSLMDGVLVSQNKREMPQMQSLHLTNAFLSMEKNPSSSGFKKVPERDRHILMPYAAAINYADTAGFIITPLLKSEAGVTWLKKGKLVVDSAMVEFSQEDGDVRSFFASLSKKAMPAVNEDTVNKAPLVPDTMHDEQGSFITLLAMHRSIGNKEQRIVVAGDADFISNMRAMQHKTGILLYSWLANGVYPIAIPGIPPRDIFLTITGKTAAQLKLFFVWLLPALVLLSGTVLLIRRKRK